MERVTLQTVADAVGVSRTTVSNAYSRPDQLNPELRRRILDTAEQLGYPGPNATARSLRRGQAGALGLLFSEHLPYAFADPYAVGFLRGLSEISQEAGTGLLLLNWPTSQAAPDSVADAVVDAFCVFSLPDGHPTMAAAERRRLPIVVVDGPFRPASPFVGIDAQAAGRALADHVLGLGHRRLAVAASWLYHGAQEGMVDANRPYGHPYGITNALLMGFRDGCRAFGLDWRDVPCYHGGNSFEVGRRAAERLTSSHPPPTAILATTDQLALGIVGWAAQRGVRVPQELSVTGFDDIPPAAGAGLTTVRQPKEDKGRAAGRLLLQTPADQAPQRTILPHELLVRTSTAPPG